MAFPERIDDRAARPVFVGGDGLSRLRLAGGTDVTPDGRVAAHCQRK